MSRKPYAIIGVSQPVLEDFRTEKVAPFVTYLVAGVDPHGQFQIRRRFREFLLLRNKLAERFLGLYVPPIPSKRAAGNTEERYVEERRRFLHYFCMRIAERPYLFDCDIFQTFIRGDPDFERASKVIPSHEYALIANIYRLEFGQAAKQADLAQVLVSLQTEAEALRLVEKLLTAIREQLLEAAESKRLLVAQFEHCYRKVLPQFENEFVVQHGGKAILGQNSEFSGLLAEYWHFSQDNLVLEYVEMVNYDLREARAFLQAIESRRQLETRKANFETVRRQSKEELQKLKGGKTTLKSIFSMGNKDKQIKEFQTNIPLYEQSEAHLDECLPLSAVAIHRYLQQFKATRPIDYLSGLQTLALKEMRLLCHYGALLNAGLRSDSLPHHNEQREQP